MNSILSFAYAVTMSCITLASPWTTPKWRSNGDKPKVLTPYSISPATIRTRRCCWNVPHPPKSRSNSRRNNTFTRLKLVPLLNISSRRTDTTTMSRHRRSPNREYCGISWRKRLGIGEMRAVMSEIMAELTTKNTHTQLSPPPKPARQTKFYYFREVEWKKIRK